MGEAAEKPASGKKKAPAKKVRCFPPTRELLGSSLAVTRRPQLLLLLPEQ